MGKKFKLYKPAQSLLKEEQKLWCKNHPCKFFASPDKNPDGTTDFFNWTCKIPGKDGTPWEGGYYNLQLIFDEQYPVLPPKCLFEPPIFHPNVYPTGLVSLTTFVDNENWINSLSVENILISIQRLLAKPNEHDPVCPEAVRLFCYNKLQYDKRIRKQTKSMRPNIIRCECGCSF